MDEIFRSAIVQRHNIAISGGTDEFSSRLSLEYTDREGTLVGTYSKNLVARLNTKWTVNKYVRIREDASWRNYEVNDANTSSAESGVILSALQMPRNVSPIMLMGVLVVPFIASRLYRQVWRELFRYSW